MLRYKSGRRRSKSNHSWFYRDRANDMFQTRKKKKKNFYVTRVYIRDDPVYAFPVFVGKIERQTRHAILHHVFALYIYNTLQLFEL